MSCVSFILLSLLLSASQSQSQSQSHADHSTEVLQENVRTFYKNFHIYPSEPSDYHSSRHGNGGWNAIQNQSPHFTSKFITVPIPISYNAAFWKFWLENYSNFPRSILKERDEPKQLAPIYQYKLHFKKPQKPAHTKQNYNILIRANINDNENDEAKWPLKDQKKKSESSTFSLTNAEKAAIQQVLKDYTQNEIVRLLQTENGIRSKSREKDSAENLKRKRKRRSPAKAKEEQTKEALSKINEICNSEVEKELQKTEEKTENGIETIDGVEYAVFKGVFMDDPDIDYYKVGIGADVPKNAELKTPADKKKSRRKKRTSAFLSKHLRGNSQFQYHKRVRRSPEEKNHDNNKDKDKDFKANLKKICRAATPTTIEERPGEGSLIETIDGVDYAIFQGVYHEDPDLDFYKIGLVETGSKSKKENSSQKEEEPPASNDSPHPIPAPEPPAAPVENTEPALNESPHPIPAPEPPVAPVENTETPEISTTVKPEESEKPTEANPEKEPAEAKTEQKDEEQEKQEVTEPPQESHEKKGKVAQAVESKEHDVPARVKGIAALFACPGPRCRGGKSEAKQHVDDIFDKVKKGKADAIEAEKKNAKEGKTVTPANNKSNNQKLPIVPHGATHTTSKLYSLHEENLHYDDEGDHTPKKKKKKPGTEKPKKLLLNPFAKFG